MTGRCFATANVEDREAGSRTEQFLSASVRSRGSSIDADPSAITVILIEEISIDWNTRLARVPRC